MTTPYADGDRYLRNLLNSKDGRAILESSAAYLLGLAEMFLAFASSGGRTNIHLGNSLENILIWSGAATCGLSFAFTVTYACLREQKLLDIFKNPNPVIMK